MVTTVKQGTVTSSKEWAKHLRPYGKREFWKGERREANREARLRSDEDENDALTVSELIHNGEWWPA